MWPWQQKKSAKTEQQLFWNVLKFSALGHLVVIIIFLLSGRSSLVHVSMRSFPTNARIVCVPSFMLPSCKNRYAGPKRGARASVIKRPAPGAEPEIVPEKRTTTVEQGRKRSRRELRQERIRARKLEREKKLLEAQEAQQKRAAQQRAVKDREKLEREQRENEEKRIEHTQQEAPTQEASENGDGGDETVIYVDSATYQMTEVVKELQEALQQVWEAPAGFAIGYSCEVTVTISGTGIATAAAITKKSGSAIYDTAARRASTAALYPKVVYNRTIVIHFGE